MRVLFINKNLCLEKFQAFLFVYGCINAEGLQQEFKGFFLVQVLVIVVGDLSVDEYCPEEIDKDGINDGILVECLLNANKLARLKYFEELKEESLELKIVEDGFLVGLEENKSKIGVQQELLQFSDVEFDIVVFDFVAEDEILEVEGSDVGMWIIDEDLQSSGWVVEVLVEERRISGGVGKDAGTGVVFELANRFAEGEDVLDHIGINKSDKIDPI